MEDFKGAC